MKSKEKKILNSISEINHKSELIKLTVCWLYLVYTERKNIFVKNCMFTKHVSRNRNRNKMISYVCGENYIS